jgi:hypothetical protein
MIQVPSGRARRHPEQAENHEHTKNDTYGGCSATDSTPLFRARRNDVMNNRSQRGQAKWNQKEIEKCEVERRTRSRLTRQVRMSNDKPSAKNQKSALNRFFDYEQDGTGLRGYITVLFVP